jgi:hypothetical protein
VATEARTTSDTTGDAGVACGAIGGDRAACGSNKGGTAEEEKVVVQWASRGQSQARNPTL